jgi:hypothetical protein
MQLSWSSSLKYDPPSHEREEVFSFLHLSGKLSFSWELVGHLRYCAENLLSIFTA